MEGSTTQPTYKLTASAAIALSTLIGVVGINTPPSFSAEQSCQAVGRVLASSNQQDFPQDNSCVLVNLE